MSQQRFDVIVVGGGHAAAEAAWAAARMGMRTGMVTMSVSSIGRMSCNPAIGGIGKGQIVREIDAMGGLMGLAADVVGIQFRMLNRRKGPAVRAPRAQADRAAYARRVRTMLEETPGLEIIQGTVTDVAVRRNGQSFGGQAATGVVLADGRRLPAAAVVLTTGTFLRGLIHCGPRQFAGGRLGEPSAEHLSDALERMGFRLGRLKTGTPPRVHRESIDFGRLQAQPGDDEPVPFSFLTDRILQSQTCCWITYTNAATHDLIRANLHLAPMYSGQIRSTGPRYCPSIEDKVVRFAEKGRHQIFLEPEGTDSERIYCNGIPTSLPVDVQRPMVRSIEGMEGAEILQYGYAIEYDYVPPDQLHATLESKPVAGLFLAGQTNGTSGYEEAAGQGLIAGVNAARLVQGREPITLRRDQGYIGVMIDDLVTRPPTEPYRMFTSRAEYRLHLRSDNADERLTPLGHEVGLVDDERWLRFADKQDQLTRARRFLETHRRDGRSLADWLRRPDLTWRDLLDGDAPFAANILEQIEIELKYSGYIDRQRRQIERFNELESRPLPVDLDYASVDQLRAEARERLSAVAPRSLGQASRISGITPADLTILMIHLQRRARSRRSG
jgi:tRNA uridine 5-carboxymethylaminomethyl modification enzyme